MVDAQDLWARKRIGGTISGLSLTFSQAIKRIGSNVQLLSAESLVPLASLLE
jgi:hypothetical protein